MSVIIQRTHYNEKELIEINMCQMYLQVLTLANITEGGGIQITTYAAKGKRDLSQISLWKWPRIPYPPAAAWAKWRGAIDTVFLSGGSRFIHKPLQEWIQIPHQQHPWPMYNESGSINTNNSRNNRGLYDLFPRLSR